MRYFVLSLLVVVLLESSKAQEDIYEINAVVGHSVELPCNVTAEDGHDTLKVVAWYRDGSSEAFYSRDLRDGDGDGAGVTSASGSERRYQVVASESEGLEKLEILSARPSDAGLYHCFADFESSPAHKTYMQLNVIEPPQRLWVIHENGTRAATARVGANTSVTVGPYYVGDVVHLYCVAFGGKPLSSLSWWAAQQLLKDAVTPLSEQRVRSDLALGPLQREDHGLVLTCRAGNSDKIAPIAIDIIVDMLLPPELVSVRDTSAGADAGPAGGGRARAGQALRLQCRVLGARPAPDITWQLNDAPLYNLEQNVTMEPSQRLAVSEVRLSMAREHDEARVSCCAPANRRGDEAFVCAPALPLTVVYPPALQIVMEGELENSTLAVMKGSTVAMNCSHQANPSAYQLIWFHEDDIISHEGEDEETSMQPTLELRNVTEQDAGEYVCAASNDEGSSYSEPVTIDVTYPAYCEDDSIAEYGINESDSVNISCKVKANPAPGAYRWVFVDEATDAAGFRADRPHTTAQTDGPTLLYQRPNRTAFNTIFCWGMNGVFGEGLQHTPCTFLVTDETVPRPPTDCAAARSAAGDIGVTCEKGHDGGLPQKFKLVVSSTDSEDEFLSIISLEPNFIIQEPKQENYKLVVAATNDKGDSKIVEITRQSILNETVGRGEPISAVTNITTLTLALCGGVLLVALAACGLVLCAHERGSRPELPRAASDPPLCAFNTEESNCETYRDSDEGSECNVRRTESFRKAVSRYPSKNFDVRRTSSFHSARYMDDTAERGGGSKRGDITHSADCRVHSLQNINRRREMDVLCDHLVMHLPPETNYHVPKPMNTFYTMPRKQRSKMVKQFSDEASEITQTSDGFSLPPPPDEFGTYRAASRIKDIPSKPSPTYTAIRKKSTGKEPHKQYGHGISPMNTVGLPAVGGAQSGLYSYPDDDHRVNTNPFDDDST